MNFLIVFLVILILGIIAVNYVLRYVTRQRDGEELSQDIQDQVDNNFRITKLSSGRRVEGNAGDCAIYRWNNAPISLNVDSVEGDARKLNKTVSCTLPNEYYLRKVSRECNVKQELQALLPNGKDTCLTSRGDEIEDGDSVLEYIRCPTIKHCSSLYAQVSIGPNCITIVDGTIQAESCADSDRYTDKLDRQLFAVFEASKGVPDTSDTGGEGDSQEGIGALPNYFYLGNRGTKLQLIQVYKDGSLILGSSGTVFGLGKKSRLITKYKIDKQDRLTFDADNVPVSLLAFGAYSPNASKLDEVTSLYATAVQQYRSGYNLTSRGSSADYAKITTHKPYD